MQDIYIINNKNSMRYALGSNSENILYVIGVNPSVASNAKLDPTVTNVKKFSELLGFDSFVMLNLYPQRSTDPNKIHKRINKIAHSENLRVINELVVDRATVWAAWGNLVEHREFLPICMLDIINILKQKKVSWIKYDDFKPRVNYAWILLLPEEFYEDNNPIYYNDGLLRVDMTNSNTYEGQFINRNSIQNAQWDPQNLGSKFNGFGQYLWDDNDVYSGYWNNGKQNGVGLWFKNSDYSLVTEPNIMAVGLAEIIDDDSPEDFIKDFVCEDIRSYHKSKKFDKNYVEESMTLALKRSIKVQYMKKPLLKLEINILN